MRYALSILCGLAAGTPALAQQRPNVLLVITDDQGFGDLGAHGNPVVRTPNLDAFTKQSAWLKNFHVSPVCSPTRAALLSGQYNYRTGVVDTFIGRSLMRPDVTILPQLLAGAGYRTGLFGKWHLGDNYPLRPEDRGFQDTLWSRGGGLAQPSDHPDSTFATAYFDPFLTRNGKEERTKGYCTDVFTDAAVRFVGAKSERPFFAYVAYNAPHGPYQVPPALVAPYRGRDLSATGFPQIGQPWAGKKDNAEDIARAYAMIENVDTNFARLLKAIEDAGQAQNTIVIFLTDNGPGDTRFNAGLRNRKGTVYEGGTRVPCYVRWPGRVTPGHVVETPLAHVDIVPTLIDACAVPLPDIKLPLDGVSALGLLTGRNVDLPARTLFVQWHRGDVPERYRAFAARGPRFKLVQANGVAPDAKWTPRYELFDIPADPFEQRDLAAEKPDEVARLKAAYDAWFTDVTKRGFDPARIVVGSEKENPVRLSRQDWRGSKAGWAADSVGHWEVRVERPGRYRLGVRAARPFTACAGAVGGRRVELRSADPLAVMTTTIELPAGDARVELTLGDGDGATRRGPTYVELEFLGPVPK
ncbi:arylsulfatase [Urbifossiella limnaea]|uniref:Arylsulfatase n=1 Tax=Urbifossiella limnaea TaxID=2528023 RepID=A0A517XY64_9BACT|nr:arylsulfatase [Urbifossiella limnaea]QDU22467.1 Arylsulfatase precursor [Urbifossiella limnaea]